MKTKESIECVRVLPEYQGLPADRKKRLLKNLRDWVDDELREID